MKNSIGFWTVLIVLAVMVLSFFATAGLVWVVCWAFNFGWSWKLSIGICALMFLVSAAVKSNVNKN